MARGGEGHGDARVELAAMAARIREHRVFQVTTRRARARRVGGGCALRIASYLRQARRARAVARARYPGASRFILRRTSAARVLSTIASRIDVAILSRLVLDLRVVPFAPRAGTRSDPSRRAQAVQRVEAPARILVRSTTRSDPSPGRIQREVRELLLRSRRTVQRIGAGPALRRWRGRRGEDRESSVSSGGARATATLQILRTNRWTEALRNVESRTHAQARSVLLSSVGANARFATHRFDSERGAREREVRTDLPPTVPGLAERISARLPTIVARVDARRSVRLATSLRPAPTASESTTTTRAVASVPQRLVRLRFAASLRATRIGLSRTGVLSSVRIGAPLLGTRAGNRGRSRTPPVGAPPQQLRPRAGARLEIGGGHPIPFAAPVQREAAPDNAAREALRSQVTERVLEQVDGIVDRRVRETLRADSRHMRRLRERVFSDLGSRLVFEQERLRS